MLLLLSIHETFLNVYVYEYSFGPVLSIIHSLRNGSRGSVNVCSKCFARFQDCSSGDSNGGGPPSYPTTPPPPQPPMCSKRDVYTNTSVFETIDQVAISVAQSEVTTFTELIRTLTASARSDVEKARYLFVAVYGVVCPYMYALHSYLAWECLKL